MSISLSAIVPVYNEEKFVTDSLNNLLHIKEIDIIYVVDDCSTDKSSEIIKKISMNNKKIKVYKTDVNRGKGGAICLVQDLLKTDYVIIHDADLEYTPTDITKLLKSVNKTKSNLVIGSRFINNKKQIYLRTYLANKGLSLFFSIVYNVKITDIATCYKLMPTNYFKNTRFSENGFAIEVELLAKYYKTSRDFSEVPISYSARSYKDGKKIKLKDGFKYLYTILKYRF